LDVHAPHEQIHSKKDFFLHLLTITIGLLIAVGIEGAVELYREHKLVKEARTTMREEIEYNSRQLNEALGKLNQETDGITKNIDLLTRILQNPKTGAAKNASINAQFSITGLRDTAWKTAQTTGALTFMPYTDSRHYTEVYETQQEFLSEQQKILDDEAQFLGMVAKSNFGHGDVTKNQASAALERFGIWRAHLVYVRLMAKIAAADNKAFLEGKEGPHEMHESVGGGGK